MSTFVWWDDSLVNLHCLQSGISNLGLVQHGLELTVLGEGMSVITAANELAVDPNARHSRLSRLVLQVGLNLSSFSY